MTKIEKPTLTANFSDKVVMITGASGGVGAQFAQAFARAGAKVALTARRLDELNKLKDQIERDGGTAFAAQLDVTDVEQMPAILDLIKDNLGEVDILINNAGINSRRCELLDVTLEDYQKIMDTNLRGVLFLSQAVAKKIQARKDGNQFGYRIINIASISGMSAFPQFITYGSSKAALIHLTKGMAMEWAKYGITVNAICPGLMRTDMTANFVNSEEGQKFIANSPRNRFGEPGYLISLAFMLASDESHYISGAIIKADDAFLG